MKLTLTKRVVSLLLIALIMLPMMTPLMAVFAADSPRADWSTVGNPSISNVTTTADGKLSVTAQGLVGNNGGDYLTINIIQNGKVITSAKSNSLKSEHTLLFPLVESYEYTVEAVLTRAGEVDKKSDPYSYNYTLPLSTPYVTNVTNLGSNQTRIVWNAVREATEYHVSVDGGSAQVVTDREITLNDLSTGKHTIQVTAVAGERTKASEVINFEVTAEAKTGWNYVIYGPSASIDKNSYTLLENNSIRLSSKNGGGKLQTTGADGLGFYYTAVPTDKNFTFRAKIYVNSWTYNNGQEGFGLMVTDHVPSSSYMKDVDFWTNQYQAAATKIEYRYATDEEGGYSIFPVDMEAGTKYSMKLGIGTIAKTGIDQSIIDRKTLGESDILFGQNGYLQSVVNTLERQAGFFNEEAGSYNIIGNWYGNAPEGSYDPENLTTELTLEIVKNNTGYFITYYDTNGNVVRRIKNYEPDALEKFDKDYVYVGMFSARSATVTFSDISLTLIDKEDDAAPESRPIELIVPKVTVTSSTTTTTTNYNLIIDTNVVGTFDVELNGKTVVSNVNIEAYERYSDFIDLSGIAQYDVPNALVIKFKPDPDQELPEYTKLSTTGTIVFEMELMLYKGNYHRKNIYVAPHGLYNGDGTPEHPYDLYTAIQRVVPGQTIILMEGTYILKTGIRIQRGMDGTAENPIRLIADPEAQTRPVLDFVHEGTGMTLGASWWYLFGFDVTNTLDSYKGIQVSGNNNVLNQINTYHNGNTGIQISRYHSADILKSQWPSNNLILNCTSYGNADKGYEDADGFAAKLTIGDGNVFDGCVAHHNADDGWDLYAKVATGPIGAVVIKNCIAYENGYLEDGTDAGNGNGFKMGGDSLPAQHQLINCIAFNNKKKGIDSNSCPDIIVKNSISYNNESYNVAFYTNTADNTDYVAEGLISIKDEYAKNNIKDNLKALGNQDKDKYLNATNYYWIAESDDAPLQSKNSEGNVITNNIFVSIEFNGFTRNEDGTINLGDFLKVKDGVLPGVGTTGDSTPSPAITIFEDEECTFSEEWTTTDIYAHWKECECGHKSELGDHEFVVVIDRETTPEKPGLRHHECTTCGAKTAQFQDYYQAPVENEAPGGFIGFLQMIINAIINFFKSLFRF